MKKLTKRLAPLTAAAALLIAGGLPLAAQEVSSVRIAVVDPETGEEVGVLSPGQEFTMLVGEEVLVRLIEPNPDRRHDRRNLPGTFGFGPSDTALEIVSSSPERGEAVVRLDDSDAGKRWHLGYKLSDRLDLADEDLQLGRVLVRVGGPGSTSITGAEYEEEEEEEDEEPADAVVAALYRGILLRDPDNGAAGARRDLERNGYNAVRRIAENIANSDESERLYDEVTNARRLEAIYGELMGWDRSDVSRDRWNDDLREIEDGNLAGVVDALVRSGQFRSRFGV